MTEQKRINELAERYGPVGPLFMQWDEVAKLHGFDSPLEPYVIATDEHLQFIRSKQEEGLTGEEIALSLGWPGTPYYAEFFEKAMS